MDPELLDQEKRNAGLKAVDFIKDNTIVGLGTGSTVLYLIQALAKRIKEENLNITGIATSRRTHKIAENLGIKMKGIDEVDHVDLTIDGADEIDHNFQGIKGGGAAHAFEKIVATSSYRNIWVVDETKIVPKLGKFPLPLEVIPYGSSKVFQRLEAEGLEPRFRVDKNGDKIKTHSNNYVIDLCSGIINHPRILATWLNSQVGILEHGLFLDIVDVIIVGKPDGADVIPAIRH